MRVPPGCLPSTSTPSRPSRTTGGGAKASVPGTTRDHSGGRSHVVRLSPSARTLPRLHTCAVFGATSHTCAFSSALSRPLWHMPQTTECLARSTLRTSGMSVAVSTPALCGVRPSTTHFGLDRYWPCQQRPVKVLRSLPVWHPAPAAPTPLPADWTGGLAAAAFPSGVHAVRFHPCSPPQHV